MAVVLLLTTLDMPTIEYPIMGRCQLGRSSSCDLTVEDKQMSGKHGFFEYTEQGQLFYSDMGSSNGSYLNNSQIQTIQFKINETLRLGNTIITIDEKRLNARERIAIGMSALPKDDKTMLISKATKSIINTDTGKEPSNQSKSVLLNKDLKKKTKGNWMGGSKESLIEQEASTGKTKLLKLDVNKHKKKK